MANFNEILLLKIKKVLLNHNLSVLYYSREKSFYNMHQRHNNYVTLCDKANKINEKEIYEGKVKVFYEMLFDLK